MNDGGSGVPDDRCSWLSVSVWHPFHRLVSHFLHQFVACCVCACVYLGVYIRQAGKKGYISEVVGALLSASLMHSHHGVRAGWP